MRLRTFTDYCLRVLIYLAIDPDRRATVGEIAVSFDVSEHHLTKVVRFLARHRLVASVRGRGGGLTLGRPASAINVGEVMRIAEGGAHPAECFDRDSNTCVISPSCRLRSVLEEASSAFYEVLGRYSLEDLAGQRRALAKILSLPAVAEIPLRRIERKR